MIRLGRIAYVNMAPVYFRLEAEVEEVSGVPTELARMLLAGEVDVAAIPSIEFARNAGELEVVFRPERRPAVKVLLLLDVGGSMEPHVELCERLFTA